MYLCTESYLKVIYQNAYHGNTPRYLKKKKFPLETKFRYNSVKSVRRYIGAIYGGILMPRTLKKPKSYKNRLKT